MIVNYLLTGKIKNLRSCKNKNAVKTGQESVNTSMPILTFKDGHFLLTDNEKETYLNFNAALKHRSVADETAERVFTRAFVKHYDISNLKLPGFLDPHQKEGVQWILSRSRSYLAHAPGAGKTAQAIVSSLLAPGSGQILFIVPPSLTINWKREIDKFSQLLNGDQYVVSTIPNSGDKGKAKWDAPFIICPDSMITREWVLGNLLSMKKKFVAIDEASRFKDETAQRTLALFGGRLKNMVSTGLIQSARHAVLLDGSPMPNRPIELWAPTYAMSPESIDFMPRTEFGMKYCGATLNHRFGNWEFKHSSNQEELKEKLQKSFMHVVSEDELEHPERLRSITFMNEDVRTADIKSWEKRHLKTVDLTNVSEGLSQGDMAAYRNRLGVKKVPWIANYVSDKLLAKNESILLFGWHRNVLEELHDELRAWSPALIIGGVDDLYREHAFAQFQKGKLKLIIGNIAAMGRGHNLQRADRIIFGEFAWSDEVNKQAEKRASRRGSDKMAIRCEYICCPNSMDEMILNAVFTKAKNVKRIIG